MYVFQTIFFVTLNIMYMLVKVKGPNIDPSETPDHAKIQEFTFFYWL